MGRVTHSSRFQVAPALGAAVAACAVVAIIAGGARASRVVRGVHDQRVMRRPSEMVRVPGGSFVMGMSNADLEDLRLACAEEIGPDLADPFCGESNPEIMAAFTHEPLNVYLGDYDIDRYEVTNAQYRACLAAGRCELRPLVTGDTRYSDDALPAVNITWQESATYCEWRGKRLPTEAEWEKAARGTDGRAWPWGNVDGDDRANRGGIEADYEAGLDGPDVTVDEVDGAKVMIAPGGYRWGKSPYGVHDMAGNVSEWVADWYSERGYDGQSAISPTGPATGSFRVVRGGSYFEPRFWARTFYRRNDRPTERSITRGFRCAKDVARGRDGADGGQPAD